MSTDTITARGGYDQAAQKSFLAIEEPVSITVENLMDIYEAIFSLRITLRKAGFDVNTFEMTCKLHSDEEE
jgi:hypothetical protein